MGPISDRFTHDHKHCDDLWVRTEDEVVDGRWDEASRAWAQFRAAMERHLGQEETQLFPAFEAATGMSAGPTAVMRLEHEQMRVLFAELAAAIAQKDQAAFAGAGQTMLILMQQHNMKEENVLYPMCDRALEGDRGLIDSLLAVLGKR